MVVSSFSAVAIGRAGRTRRESAAARRRLILAGTIAVALNGLLLLTLVLGHVSEVMRDYDAQPIQVSLVRALHPWAAEPAIPRRPVATKPSRQVGERPIPAPAPMVEPRPPVAPPIAEPVAPANLRSALRSMGLGSACQGAARLTPEERDRCADLFGASRSAANAPLGVGGAKGQALDVEVARKAAVSNYRQSSNMDVMAFPGVRTLLGKPAALPESAGLAVTTIPKP